MVDHKRGKILVNLKTLYPENAHNQEMANSLETAVHKNTLRDSMDNFFIPNKCSDFAKERSCYVMSEDHKNS